MLDRYERPDSLEEAWALLQQPHHVALAGGTLSQLGAQEHRVGVELRHLLSGPVCREGERYVLPAMTTLRTLETDPRLCQGGLSLLSRAVCRLQGPAFRNIATVGGAICSRFAKSELNTVLLALGAQVRLFAGGELPLEEIFSSPRRGDILCAVTVPVRPGPAGFYALRRGDTEQPLLCAAVRRDTAGWRAAVGARPGLARMRVIPGHLPPEQLAEQMAGKWDYGSDQRASGEYRRLVAPAVLCRALEEAMTCL